MRTKCVELCLRIMLDKRRIWFLNAAVQRQLRRIWPVMTSIFDMVFKCGDRISKLNGKWRNWKYELANSDEQHFKIAGKPCILILLELSQALAEGDLPLYFNVAWNPWRRSRRRKWHVFLDVCGKPKKDLLGKTHAIKQEHDNPIYIVHPAEFEPWSQRWKTGKKTLH